MSSAYPPPSQESGLILHLGQLPEYYRLMENPYFGSLREGSMTKEVFRDSQKQFFFAVRYFSRPMAALMARMPDSSARKGLIHNLAEEHGFEEGPEAADFAPEMAHDLTMLKFLASLGVPAAEMVREREGSTVKAFNLALMGGCLMEQPEFAFAALGAIEFSFAGISALIGQRTVECGWIRHEDLVHYKLHAEIDRRHAADFLAPLEEAWQEGGQTGRIIGDGLAFGLHLFDQLYADLLRDARPAL